MTRLARVLCRLHSAAVALRDHNAALESLRLVNRELLVTAYAEVPPEVAAKCDLARGHVLEAVRLLDPLPAGQAPETEEISPAAHRILVASTAGRFGAITDPPGLN
jgi:hypothetical protein